jgi:hypothetical protein
MSNLTLYFLDFGACMNGNSRVALNINHFGGENAHRAVICRKCFIQLSHVPANSRFTFNQVHLDTMIGNIQGSLNSGNPGTYDNYITHGGHTPWRAPRRRQRY